MLFGTVPYLQIVKVNNAAPHRSFHLFSASRVIASRHQQAAGDTADLAGDKASLIQDKIEDEGRHLPQAAEPAERRLVHPAPVRVRADSLSGSSAIAVIAKTPAVRGSDTVR
jgi:hypothetical protein